MTSREARRLTTALELARRKLPFPIARRAGEALERDSLASLLFLTEATLRFSSVVAKAAYLCLAPAPMTDVNKAIGRLLHPSMGSWWGFLQAVRPYFDDGSIPEPCTGFASSLSILSSDDMGKLVQLRNEALGHFGGEIPDDWAADLKDDIADSVVDLLDAARVFDSTTLLVWDSHQETWLRCLGETPEISTSPELDPREAPAVLLGADGRSLRLFPLVVTCFEGYKPRLAGGGTERVLVFDGVDIYRKQIVYMGQYGRGIGRAWFQEYRDLLARSSCSPIPGTLADLEEGELRARAIEAYHRVHESAKALGTVHPGVEQLDDNTQSAIKDAIDGGSRALIVSGAAGIGKTAHLHGAATASIDRGHVPVLFSAKELLGNPKQRWTKSLQQAVGAHWSVVPGGAALETLCTEVAAYEGDRPARVVLMLDGLDEIGHPQRVHEAWDEIRTWWAGAGSRIPGLFLVVSLRDSLVDSLERRGASLDLEGLYHPTGKSRTGSDAIDRVLWLLPPSQGSVDVVGARYERFRALAPDCRPRTSFDDLEPETRDACRNARWMILLLKHFHDEDIPPLVGPVDLWRHYATKHVFAEGVGRKGRPKLLHPDRARLVKRVLELHSQHDLRAPELDELCSDPSMARLADRMGEDVLTILESIGVLSVEPSDEGDIFSPTTIKIENDHLLVALFVETWTRTADLRGIAGIVRDRRQSPRWHVLADAFAMTLARVVEDRPEPVSAIFHELEPIAAHRAVLAMIGQGVEATLITDLLLEMEPDARAETLVSVLAQAWTSGSQARLAPLAQELMNVDPVDWSEPLVELVATTLRFTDDSSLHAWLGEAGGLREDLAACIHFHAAEACREKGRWRVARDLYTRSLEREDTSSRRALALAARGESSSWLGEHAAALRDLQAAHDQLGESPAFDIRCNLHIKRAISARIAARYPLAVAELLEAEKIALSHGFVTEVAKILIEKGLVALAFELEEECFSCLEIALEKHRAQGSVKGQKKALYCLGRAHVQFKRPAKALDYLRESLALNEHYFDLLGLDVCHRSIAGILAASDEGAATKHIEKADAFRHRRLTSLDRSMDALELQELLEMGIDEL